MPSTPYKVYVVVDRQFGERLAEVEPGAPVWIVATPAKKPVAKRIWEKRPTENHLTGVTTFNDQPSASPEEILLSELDTIDLHHGPHSADPPYTIIEVFGTPLTAKLQSELSAYGFNEFHPTASGFTAERPESAAKSR